MNNIDNDLRRIALQEQQLQFERFDLDTAWTLGSTLRRMAAERKHGVVIDVTLFSMQVFYAALDGATPDNPNWVRRKRNTVSGCSEAAMPPVSAFSSSRPTCRRSSACRIKSSPRMAAAFRSS